MKVLARRQVASLIVSASALNLDERQPAARQERSLRRFAVIAARHPRRVAFAVFVTTANKMFDVMPELLIGVAIDVLVRGKKSFVAEIFDITDRWHQFLVLAVINVVIWIGESITDYLSSLAWRNLAQDVQHEMRTELYAHVQRLDLAWFEDRSSGGLLAVMNDDVNQLERFLDVGASDILRTFTNVLFVGIFFFLSSPLLALMAFLPIPIIMGGSLWWQTRLAPRYATVRETVSDLSSALVNNLAGMATISAFTAEDREEDRINGLSSAYRTANRAAIKYSSAFIPLIRMAILFGFTATLLVGGRLTLDGALNVGLFTSLVYSTQRLLWPLTRLGETFDLYQRASASTQRILELQRVEPTIVPGHRDFESRPVGALAFRDVRFAFGSGSEG